MSKRHYFVYSLLLVAGLAAGFVISGRLGQTSATFAGSQATPSTPRAATAAAAGQGLPDLSAIAELAVQASANISSTQIIQQRNDPFMDFFFGGGRQYSEREAQSLGSGVVVSEDGYILTNAHVLIGNGGTIRDVRVSLPAGRSDLAAKIVGLDEVSDLALLKVDAKGLPTLKWGDSDKVRIAEWVLAIGNPFEFNQTVTLGIVSAKGRTGAQIGAYGQMIQTDAAINPGNSGGALVNSRGELIGINSMIYSRGGGSEGLGFAIPANLAQRIMKELRENGAVAWGTIAGVQFEDVGVNRERAREFGITTPSVVVAYPTSATSGAARAGLRRGDVLLSFDGKPVATVNDLLQLMWDAKIGGTATLEILRGSSRLKIAVPITSTTK
ncbi:MAG: trypsin-like serine protease [Acidobacteria bacterium]|nr:MAG: trypsin-like serine protease [Acidobacteriota bacterium]